MIKLHKKMVPVKINTVGEGWVLLLVGLGFFPAKF